MEFRKSTNTEWDKIEDYEAYIYNFLLEIKRVLTKDGTCWMFCGRTKIFELDRAIRKSGLINNVDNLLTYVRAKGRGADDKLKSQCEEIFHITKTDKYQFDMIEYERDVVTPYVLDGRPRGWGLDLNTGNRVRWSGMGNACLFTSPFTINKFEPQIHSTQKPVLLNVMLMMLSSKEGDTVYDFFSGSGSSGVAAILSGRNWVGCELDKDMYKKSLNWLQNIDFKEAQTYVNKRLKYKDDPYPSTYITDINKIKDIENKNKVLKGGLFKNLSKGDNK